jgi:hypothetical protein
MENRELGWHSKEALSWMVIAEVLKIAAGPLRIGILHPGGGQYDSLCLITPTGDPVMQLNRNGVNALAGDELVENIWETAANNPRLAALRIMDEGNLPAELEPTEEYQNLSLMATNIANYLTLNLNTGTSVEWGWFDSTYGSNKSSVLDSFKIPEEWKVAEPAFPGTEWQSNIFIILKAGVAVAAVNAGKMEAVNPEGESWSPWPLSYVGVDDLVSPHVGFHIVAKDSTGGVAYDGNVHPAIARRVRKMLMEEVFDVQVTPIFEYGLTTQDDAVAIWLEAQGDRQDPEMV